jgi:actin-like ATPase involved in cell morphogenesis
MSAAPPFLGIDFGTSKSTMAWLNPRTGQAEIIKNAEGEEKTPSVVYFGADGTLVGTPAENMLEEEEQRGRVVVSVKRSIARPMRIALPDGRLITPPEVAVEILKKLKRDAEKGHFKESVERVVLTCPAAFSEAERDALADAAMRAGFQTVELLEEPVAAALAYAEAGLKVEGHVLVYDLGGGTFDLAVLAHDDTGFRSALAPKGIRSCGGDDFDRALYDHCDEQARQTLQRSLSGNDTIDLQFLRLCRLRKESLTERERCEFSTYLPGGLRFKHAVERSTFEGLISRHVEETVRLTRSVVDEARDSGHAVATVVLIGGSSRVPLVQRLLLKDAHLPVEPQRWQQQDVAVALGAAYHGQSLWGTGGKTGDALASSASQLAPLRRLLNGQMAEVSSTGDRIAPARTIAKILALAPQDAAALQARLTLARPLLDQAMEATGKISDRTWGVLWQTQSYLSIAKVEAKLGDVPGATASLEAATKTCSALAHRPDDQLRYFEEIAALQRQIGAEDAAGVALEAARACLDSQVAAYDPEKGSSFDDGIGTLLTFGEALARLGNKAGAKGWFMAAKMKVPTIQKNAYQTAENAREGALRSIAQSQAKAGDVVGAMATLKAVKDRDFTLANIAKTQANGGDIRGAVITAKAIADSYWQGHTLGEIAALQVKQGDITGAISTIREGKDLTNLYLFVGPLTEAGSKPAIESVLNDLIETTSARSEGKKSDDFLIFLFLKLASSRIRFGDLAGAKASLDRALSLVGLQKMGAPELGIANLYAQLGEPVLAKSWFQAARKSADAMAKAADKWNVYAGLAKAQLDAGDISAARSIAEAIPDRSKDSPRWQAYEDIAVAQARAGDTAAAKATAGSIPDEATTSFAGSSPPRKIAALVAIAAVQIRAGDIPGARATVDDIPPSQVARLAFRGVAAAQICSGDRMSLESGKHGTELMKDDGFRAWVYVHAVDCLLSPDGDKDLEFMPHS